MKYGFVYWGLSINGQSGSALFGALLLKFVLFEMYNYLINFRPVLLGAALQLGALSVRLVRLWVNPALRKSDDFTPIWIRDSSSTGTHSFHHLKKLTASSRRVLCWASPSGSPKCLRFGRWLTLCTLKIHLLTYCEYCDPSNKVNALEAHTHDRQNVSSEHGEAGDKDR